MFEAPEPGNRIASLTQDVYVQRFNVAASRAKDQMWLFHSVRLSNLGSPADMRFQLLERQRFSMADQFSEDLFRGMGGPGAQEPPVAPSRSTTSVLHPKSCAPCPVPS
ncbi:hypothetical protein C8D88_12363 [Lentzea atacamensis]|uniref:DNA2/NAM7 helicase-like C-terminal domain-containing protein n=1 Tax=Lentzea atacamensis TaxID=531938 RepID=A0A316HHK1_9PSEU|nr:hypothetical protein C8D88_12363 [Lentzea atacamensis]